MVLVFVSHFPILCLWGNSKWFFLPGGIGPAQCWALKTKVLPLYDAYQGLSSTQSGLLGPCQKTEQPVVLLCTSW